MMFILSLFLTVQALIPDREIFHKPSGDIYSPTLFDSTHPYDVLHYNINIDLNFPGTSFSHAWAEITAKTEDTLSIAKFNFVGMNIDSVLVNGVTTNYDSIGSGVNQILAVDLGGTIPAGDTFTVAVSYSGTPEEGVYYSSAYGGVTYVMSIPWPGSELPVGARYWFPCYDAFNDKATSELSITVPSGYEMVANGSLEDVDTTGANWTYHWVEDYPIPTWYIVFSVAQYAVVQDSFVYGDSVMPIFHFVRQGESTNAHTAFSNVPDMLTFFSDTFGERYPFFNEKYGFVRLATIGWAMEYQTNVFWAISIPASHYYETIIAHETSHQWWGCSITPGSLKDIWLNEGFATYCEALYSDHWPEGDSYQDYMVYLMNYYLSYENSPVGHPIPIYDPPSDAVWTATTYEKAASVLHMLRHIVSDTTFFNTLKIYYATYKYGNAVTSEFQSVAETVSGQDLDWFFDEWIYKAGHPEYECFWGWDSLGSDSFRINLHIDQVQSHDWDVPTFKMPIDIEVYTNNKDTVLFVVWDSLATQDFTLFVDSKPQDIGFDPGDWILKEVTVTGIEECVDVGLRSLELEAYPNPFSKTTVIRYTLNENRNDYTNNDYTINASLKIYDMSGRLLKTFNHLTNQRFNQITWDASNYSSGIYFLKLSTGDYSLMKKLILMK